VDFGRSSLSGLERARWLAELALAIEQAEEMADRLRFADVHGAEALELHGRLQVLKREVEELRLGGWRVAAQELGSKRISLGSG